MNDKDLLEVFYDGACILCSREMNHYQKLKPTQNIKWVDISSSSFNAQSVGLNPMLVQKYMHAKRGNFLFVKVDAFLEIWKAYPKYKWMVPIANFKPIRFLFDVGYFCFATLRPYLPKKKCKQCL